MSDYYIMNKDNLVAEFSSKDSCGAVLYELGDVCGKLPYSFNVLSEWLECRQAAKHRQQIKELMKECGCDTVEGFIKTLHCTSIIDTFWVKEISEDISWEHVSLYRNEFDETISKLAFEGTGVYGQSLSLTTPEFAIDGAYQKCCTKSMEGNMWIYKRGTERYANAGLEPYCEAISSELYSIIAQNSVEYNLVDFYDKKASKCRVFTNENIGLVPYAYIGKSNELDECLSVYSKYGSEQLFRDMIVADAVCMNADRHSGNHGFLYGNDTMDIIGMAPVYDNNVTLLAYAMAYDFDDINKYMTEYNTRIGRDWVEAARNMLTSKTRSTLINLKGYRFTFRGDDKFPKGRVKAIESLVNQQINNILGMSDVALFTADLNWEK